MPALVVGALTVPNVVSGREVPAEAQDRFRTLDNTMMVTVLGDSKNAWAIEVASVTRAQVDAIKAALNGTWPLSCSGDILGATVDCVPEVHGFEAIAGSSPLLFSGSFTLHAV